MRAIIVLVPVIALMAFAGTAGAVTIYTSQTAFDAAVAGKVTFGFAEGNSANHYHVTANPYTRSGISFADNVTAADDATGGIPIPFLVGNATTPAYGVDFLSLQNTQVDISADITSPGVTALGFSYGSYITGGAATVSVNGGISTAITVLNGGLSFIGFTSAIPITDVSIFFPGGYSFDLTNVSYAGATAVPEPAIWLLMVGGFGMVGIAKRRRKHASVA